VAELMGDAQWGAHIDLAAAEIALAAGESARARKLLAAASSAFAGKNSASFEQRRVALLSSELESGGAGF